MTSIPSNSAGSQFRRQCSKIGSSPNEISTLRTGTLPNVIEGIRMLFAWVISMVTPTMSASWVLRHRSSNALRRRALPIVCCEPDGAER